MNPWRKDGENKYSAARSNPLKEKKKKTLSSHIGTSNLFLLAAAIVSIDGPGNSSIGRDGLVAVLVADVMDGHSLPSLFFFLALNIGSRRIKMGESGYYESGGGGGAAAGWILVVSLFFFARYL